MVLTRECEKREKRGIIRERERGRFLQGNVGKEKKGNNMREEGGPNTKTRTHQSSDHKTNLA